MKIWHKWTVFILVMALPVAGFAGLSFEPHCESQPLEINSSADQNLADHCAKDKEPLHKENQTSQSDHCQCECSSHFACVSAGVVALTGFAKASITHNGKQIIHYISGRIFSVNLSAIFRPPILS